MNCENLFCIYKKKGKCILEEIHLDIIGQCKECIYIKIEEKKLEKMKKESLLNLDYK